MKNLSKFFLNQLIFGFIDEFQKYKILELQKLNIKMDQMDFSAQQRIPGYTGYKPQFEDEIPGENNSQVTRDNRFYIPGKFQSKKSAMIDLFESTLLF